MTRSKGRKIDCVSGLCWVMVRWWQVTPIAIRNIAIAKNKKTYSNSEPMHRWSLHDKTKIVFSVIHLRRCNRFYHVPENCLPRTEWNEILVTYMNTAAIVVMKPNYEHLSRTVAQCWHSVIMNISGARRSLSERWVLLLLWINFIRNKTVVTLSSRTVKSHQHKQTKRLPMSFPFSLISSNIRVTRLILVPPQFSHTINWLQLENPIEYSVTN